MFAKHPFGAYRLTYQVVALLIVLPMLVAGPVNGQVPVELFRAGDNLSTELIPLDVAVVRTRSVAIDLVALDKVRPGAAVRFRLFEDAVLHARAARIEVIGPGRLRLFGHTDGESAGSFAIVVNDARVSLSPRPNPPSGAPPQSPDAHTQQQVLRHPEACAARHKTTAPAPADGTPAPTNRSNPAAEKLHVTVPAHQAARS